ncbi:MAG: hypothetical protein IKR85_06875 [Clostridia bacterium]|nr:hypothetical protein [Clostridia bacterium]
MGRYINRVTGVGRGRTARARSRNLANSFVRRNPGQGYYVTSRGDVGRRRSGGAS